MLIISRVSSVRKASSSPVQVLEQALHDEVVGICCLETQNYYLGLF